MQNPSHSYTNAGTYTVALTATNAYGNNTNTKTNYITVTGSIPNFVAAGVVACGTGAIFTGSADGIATNDILLLFLDTSNQTSASNSERRYLDAGRPARRKARARAAVRGRWP